MSHPCVMTVLTRFVRRWLVFLLLLLALAANTQAGAPATTNPHKDDGDGDNEYRTSSASCSSSSSSVKKEQEEKIGMPILTPADLPDPAWFTNFSKTIEYELPGGFQKTVQEGIVYPIQFADNKNNNRKQSNSTAVVASTTPASIAVVSAALDRQTVERIRSLLEGQQQDFWDIQPDTVDAMPTYEIYMDSPATQKEEPIIMKQMKQ